MSGIKRVDSVVNDFGWEIGQLRSDLVSQTLQIG